ncbi:MAG: biotin--[acetyl-CoA-carboxylase] ligase [Rhodospirillales bacterium]|nr:biotin--[acetyl-CoA-carboxylase] ligase [Rhodospirillales bacterium]MCB9995600.1 biotin--[acetyl-CoA-carboxylase] ligase [Rhodospirillales bacterium]
MSIDWNVHTYASLPSTQDYVKELAEEGLPEGTVIQCLEQKKGRGRHGREWVSPIGNLYMSILLRPGCDVADAGQLSFVAAVALSAAMDEVMVPGHSKTLKWPNDILIDGKKASGILIEREGDGYALGIGANIMSAPEEAICLKEVSGDNRLAIHPFRDHVLAHFAVFYKQWQEDGFAQIREKWLAQAHGLNAPIKVDLGNIQHEGIFRELDENGALVVEISESGKTIAINSGEVYFPDL